MSSRSPEFPQPPSEQQPQKPVEAKSERNQRRSRLRSRTSTTGEEALSSGSGTRQLGLDDLLSQTQPPYPQAPQTPTASRAVLPPNIQESPKALMEPSEIVTLYNNLANKSDAELRRAKAAIEADKVGSQTYMFFYNNKKTGQKESVEVSIAQILDILEMRQEARKK